MAVRSGGKTAKRFELAATTAALVAVVFLLSLTGCSNQDARRATNRSATASDTAFLVQALASDSDAVDEESTRAAVSFVRRCEATTAARVADSSDDQAADRRLTWKPQ
ncbi:MAG TPA: hypothetical protein VHD36_00915 [Pirellulales bacterium]|nr:hypothetical protein [Pirellulales bacterium]